MYCPKISTKPGEVFNVKSEPVSKSEHQKYQLRKPCVFGYSK
ncbi:MAG: virulence promoting factor [Clostridia bacterium]|nr:virulence promoting factor [Clostridia bacterium]